MIFVLILLVVVIAVLVFSLVGIRAERDEACAKLSRYETSAKALRNERETEQHKRHT